MRITPQHEATPTHRMICSFAWMSAAENASSGCAASGGGPQALSASTELACGLLMAS